MRIKSGIEDIAFSCLAKKYPSIRKNGLRGFLSEIDDMMELGGELREWKISFIPDAIIADHNAESLTVFEIEDTCPLTRIKLDKLLIFGHNLYDWTEWLLRVCVTDRYGHNERIILDIQDEI